MENHESTHGAKEMEGETKSKNEWWEWMKALAIAIVLAFIIRSFLFAPFVVDGASMMPTLHDRERVIVTKLIYYVKEPSHGDIIVFHATEERDYIKRVIGVGGDTIEMKNDQLYVNDQPVEESYLDEYRLQAQEQGYFFTGDFGPVEVPDGELYVLGDNRLNSKDSRMIGTIPLESVVGRADVIFWPINQFRLPQ